MTKRMKDVVLYDSAKYGLDGYTLEECLHKIEGWIQEYGGKSVLDIGEECTDYYGNDKEYAYVHIRGKREETEEEYAKHLDDEQARRNIQDMNDRKLYEALQKKFGGK